MGTGPLPCTFAQLCVMYWKTPAFRKTFTPSKPFENKFDKNLPLGRRVRPSLSLESNNSFRGGTPLHRGPERPLIDRLGAISDDLAPRPPSIDPDRQRSHPHVGRVGGLSHNRWDRTRSTSRFDDQQNVSPRSCLSSSPSDQRFRASLGEPGAGQQRGNAGSAMSQKKYHRSRSSPPMAEPLSKSVR